MIQHSNDPETLCFECEKKDEDEEGIKITSDYEEEEEELSSEEYDDAKEYALNIANEIRGTNKNSYKQYTALGTL